MSEFEKELDAKIKSGEIMEERYKNGCIVSYFASFKDIVSTFKDWQPPKPLVVVPKFFADWFENQLKNNESKKFDGNDIFRIIQDVIKISNDENTWEDYGITDEIAKFAEDNEELFLNLIVNCSLGYGYTVEREQLYEIRLPLPKNDDNDYALVDVKGYIWEDALPTKYKLTESEIKAIDERYWVFAVKVEEVEK